MILSRNSTKKRSLQIFKTNTTWTNVSTFSSLDLIRTNELPIHNAVPKIQELTQKLAKVVNVQRVRAIAKRFPDIHWIDFELELQPGIELSDEVWDYVQDLVIDYAWQLWEDFEEEWYFRAQVAFEPSPLIGSNDIVADSCNRQHREIGIRSWSSPPLKLVVH